MTTSPVTTITDELLAEIEAAAEAATNMSWEDELFSYDIQHGDIGENELEFILLSSPANVHAFITELRAMRAENAELVEVMRDIRRQIDGNIRPTVRDCINGMPDHNDIYDYCDAIEAAIDSAMQEQPQ